MHSVMNNIFLTNIVSHINSHELRTASNKLLVNFFEKIVKQLHPDIFLEIGARQADFSYNMSEQMLKCSFICYEANVHSYNKFSPRFKNKSNVDYLNLAISDTDGITKIHIPSMECPEVLTKGNTSLAEREKYEGTYTIESITCRRLDSLCENFEPSAKLCAWVDVEGYFRAVYNGGINVFKRLDALFIEVEEKFFWNNQALASEVFELLHQSGMVAIARDCEYVYQYNIVFVRAEKIDQIKPFLQIFYQELRNLESI